MLGNVGRASPYDLRLEHDCIRAVNMIDSMTFNLHSAIGCLGYLKCGKNGERLRFPMQAKKTLVLPVNMDGRCLIYWVWSPSGKGERGDKRSSRSRAA